MYDNKCAILQFPPSESCLSPFHAPVALCDPAAQRSQHMQHYPNSYKTSTWCQGPSCSQLLNKARFFRMIPYKLSLGRSVCLWNDSLRSLSQSSLQTQMHPVLAEQWVWIIRQKAVPVTPYLLSPAVPFFLLNFCPNTVSQWSKEKMETVTSEIERKCH